MTRSGGLAPRLAGALAAAVVLAGAGAVSSGPALAAVGHEVVFSKDGDPGYDCYRIPAIVRAANDDLLAFAEARDSVRDDCDDMGDNDLVMKRSVDDGRSWGPLEHVNTGEGVDWANPVPILDRSSGNLVLLTVRSPATSPRPRTPYVQVSEDDGENWSDPRSLAPYLGDLGEWGHFATGPGGGIQLERGHPGRLVAGINYSVASGHGAGLIYSDNGGETWRLGATDVVTDGSIRPQELSLFERTGGGVYAAARENINTDPTRPTRAFAVSSDGGDTFDAPWATVPDLPGTKMVQGSVERLRAAESGDRYNRVLFATPTYGTQRRELTVRSSYTEGRTWQTVAEGTQITDQRAGYSDLELLATGEVGLLYEGGQLDGGAANDEIRFAYFTERDLGLPDNYSGPSTPDQSGLDNDAILRGGASSGAGRFGSAVALSGSSDHVHLPFAESLAVGSGDFTFSTWLNYGDSSAAQAILWAYGQGENRSQLWLRGEPGNDRIRGWLQSRGDSAWVDAPAALDDDQWHHLVLRRQGTTLTLFVDGRSVDSATAPTGSVSPARPFTMYLGQRLDGTQRLDGRLDETRLYTRALSAGEVAGLHSDNAPVTGELVLRLPFDQLP